MSKLDPVALFGRIAKDVPGELHAHLFVTGSLAAAYHFQAQIEGQAVNTKDADLVVHPAGDVESSRRMAERLLEIGWVRTNKPPCYPRKRPKPKKDLRAIRLFPPDSMAYFIEFLNLPAPGQRAKKLLAPVKLRDGWYCLPSFKFFGLIALGRKASHVGLEYAAPEMMALANLLSHPGVGLERMQSGGPLTGKLRSAKDLGRVIALAWLAGREQTLQWPAVWRRGLEQCFPKRWPRFARSAGDGLRELLKTPLALEEARETTEVGLLSGKGVTTAMLRATGNQLLEDAIEPLSRMAKG